MEYRLRHQSGHWIWLRAILRPSPREGGGQTITGTLIEITRERELAAALDHARADLQVMVDAGPGALYRAEIGPDLSWRQLFVTSAIERITGYSPAAAKMALWGGAGLEPGGLEVLRDAARRALRHEPVAVELRLTTPSGGWVWLRNTVRSDPAGEATDEAVSVVGYLTDISFEKEQATRLAHAARVATLGELTSGVAHDFNNMLAAIANCHAVVMRQSHDALVREAIGIARAAADRGANLVRQMLAFTRHRDADAQAVDIAAVLSELYGLLRQACGDAVGLSVDAPAGLWPVAAERGALEMVIINLATNARDAMPDGGHFRLSAHNHNPAEPLPTGLAPGDYVVLAARDTGHGMGAEILARSTERFFTTKPAGQGTGLGLAMAEGFVRHWGGAMTIDSTEGELSLIHI
jgi:signal transduction histidine kinase